MRSVSCVLSVTVSIAMEHFSHTLVFFVFQAIIWHNKVNASNAHKDVEFAKIIFHAKFVLMGIFIKINNVFLALLIVKAVIQQNVSSVQWVSFYHLNFNLNLYLNAKNAQLDVKSVLLKIYANSVLLVIFLSLLLQRYLCYQCALLVSSLVLFVHQTIHV